MIGSAVAAGVFLTLALVFVTWYMEKTFNFLMNLGEAPAFGYLTDAYYWGTVALFYGTLFLHAGNLRRRVPRDESPV